MLGYAFSRESCCVGLKMTQIARAVIPRYDVCSLGEIESTVFVKIFFWSFFTKISFRGWLNAEQRYFFHLRSRGQNAVFINSYRWHRNSAEAAFALRCHYSNSLSNDESSNTCSHFLIQCIEIASYEGTFVQINYYCSNIRWIDKNHFLSWSGVRTLCWLNLQYPHFCTSLSIAAYLFQCF